MKKTNTLAFMLAAAFLCAFVAINPQAETYHVDTGASSLEWFAQKVTGKHNGTIKLSGGEILRNNDQYAGTFEIDMNTIEDKDLESPEYKAKLENHLKSPDFFDAAKYPKSKFVITSVVANGEIKNGMTHHVTGLLTIKDKTNEISFDAMIHEDGAKIFATGSAVVDRSKFDVRYGSKTFFKDIGDKMIYDEFTIRFNIVAVK